MQFAQWFAAGTIGLALVAGFPVFAQPADVELSIEQRLATLRQIEESDAGSKQRSAEIGERYGALFALDQERIENASDDDLELMFQATNLAAFYTYESGPAGDQKRVLAELAERGLAREQHYSDTYASLVGARMFEQARALAEHVPQVALEPLPVLDEAPMLHPDAPTEWVVDSDRDKLLRQSVDLHRAAQIIVVSHPLCHFSQNAMRHIQADPLLREVFAKHSKWIAPPPRRLHVQVLQQWNLDHPRMQTTVAYDADEWPLLDFSSTPTFYFLRDGAVVATITGWPDEGREAELLTAMRTLELVPTADTAE